MSSFRTPLLIEYLDGRSWRLIQGFRYDSDWLVCGAIYIPAGFVTDFASIPRGLWNLFPPTGPYGKAAVVHDFLYRQSGVKREQADRIFLEAMEELRVQWFTRYLIYAAVRLFGGRAYEAKL